MSVPDEQAAVADALAAVRAKLPAHVSLIAVSKAQPLARVEAALIAGQRVFGENYVQEAAGRWPSLRQRWPDVELHMIGGLQSNKAADAVALFDVVQSVDRPKLARMLATEATRQRRSPRVMIQVNTGEEPQKSGIVPRGLPALVTLCRDELRLPLVGLMAIPPEADDTALHAALLVKLAVRHGLPGVSIGMSDDYEIAARFGATHVRVGSAIFGKRPTRG